jgi:hypothetical protein
VTGAGIACGLTCVASYERGTVVALTPSANSGSGFDHWVGDCTGKGACAVRLDANRTVTAVFAAHCAIRMRVTYSVYGPMPKPRTDPCWRVDRPGKGGGDWVKGHWTWCGSAKNPKTGQSEWRILKPRHPQKPGYWVYDDTAGFLQDAIPSMKDCAKSAAVSAGLPRKRFKQTHGYLSTAYRSRYRQTNYVPSSTERNAVINKVGRSITFLFQVYDAVRTDFPCPAVQPNCGLHPILTDLLYSRWKAQRRHMVGMLDISTADEDTVEAQVLRLCRDSRATRHISVYAGHGSRIDGARYAAVESALTRCTHKP